MSKTLESNLWRWLKQGCRGHFRPDVFYMERVENSVGTGTPDVDGCLMGKTFKIELKTSARPARELTDVAVRFRPAQIPWMRRYAAAGGQVFVLVQVGSGATARRYLIRGRDAATVEHGVPENELSKLSVTSFDASAAEIISAAAIS